jgi:glycosyltransferase involved in cell wall biosynthesis
MTSVRVLLVHNYYRSELIGGEDVVFRAELDALKEVLGDVNVHAYTKSNDHINGLTLFLNLFFSISTFYSVFTLVRSKRVNVVHVHNFFPMISPSVFLAAKLAGAKVVMTLHNYRWWCIAGTFFENSTGICEHCRSKVFTLRSITKRCYRGSVVQSVVAAIAFALYRATRIIKLVDIFFVLTQFQQRKISDLGVPRHKIRLKPNFVETLEAEEGVKKGETVIYVGRLEHSKGVLKMLDAWRDFNIPFKLEIVGAGPLEEALKARYRLTNVDFLGRKSRSETLRYIAKAKYLLQPSIWYETFGLTIIEAMALGTPVVGFDIGTRSELVIDGYNGFLTDEAQLASTLKEAMVRPDYETLRGNAREFSRQFKKRAIMEQQTAIYREITADVGGRP